MTEKKDLVNIGFFENKSGYKSKNAFLSWYEYEESFTIENVAYRLHFNGSGNTTEIDVSQFDFPNTIWIIKPYWEIALKTAVLIPVVFGGVVFNALLFTVIMKNRILWTSTNIFIANLALADLMMLMIGPWMLLVHDFYQNYVMGVVGCKLEGFLHGALLITAVMSLCAISYDRLSAIVLPHEARLSRRSVLCVSIATWTIGIIFAFPLLIWRHYRERQWKNFLETYCYEAPNIIPIYWHVLLCTLVWIPMIIMTICYCAIFFKLDQYEKQILRRENPISVSYKTKAAKSMFIVLITFIILRIPLTVIVFWRNELINQAVMDSIGNVFPILWFMAHYLLYLNCAIDPILYGLTNENYRRSFGLNGFYKWFSGSKNTKEDTTKKAAKKNQNNYLFVKNLKFWGSSGKMELKEETPSVSEKKPVMAITSDKISPIEEIYI